MVPIFHHKLLLLATACIHCHLLARVERVVGGTLFTTQSGSTRFYKQIFTISCCATEIAIVWLWRLTFCSQIPFLGIDRCSRADQDNEESHLCSLSALTCLEIYKQVSDHISKCMSLFCGFHLWACVRSEAVTAQRLCLSSELL